MGKNAAGMCGGKGTAMKEERKAARELGENGEERAVELYRAWGYEILARNNAFHRQGELDFVALREGQLAFVEVRTRDGNSGTNPLDTVNASKRARILRAARIYWDSLDTETRSRVQEIRFDVVAVARKRYGWSILPIFGAFEGNDVW